MFELRAPTGTITLSDGPWSVSAHIGGGVPPLRNVSVGYATLPGAGLQRVQVQPRTVQLAVTARGTSLASLHALRRHLIDVVRPDATGTPALTLTYTGGSIPLSMTVAYDTGLEAAQTPLYSEQLGLQFIAYDPFWQAGVGSATLTSGSVQVVSYAGLYSQDPTTGRIQSPVAPTSANVAFTYNLRLAGGTIFGAGPYRQGGTAYGVIAYTGGTTFSYLNSRMDLPGPLAAEVGPGGRFYVIEQNGNLSAYNGASWVPVVGTLFYSILYNMAARDGNLYIIGGEGVPGVEGGTTQALYQYDGTTVTAIQHFWGGTAGVLPPNGDIRVFSGLDNRVYAAGRFSFIGTAGSYTATPSGFARWDGAVWETLGTSWAGRGTTPMRPQYVGMSPSGRAMVSANEAVLRAGTYVTVPRVAEWTGRELRDIATVFAESGTTSVGAPSFTEAGSVIYANFGNARHRGVPLVMQNAAWDGRQWTPSNFGPLLSSQSVVFGGTRYFGANISLYQASYTAVTYTGQVATLPVLTVRGNGRLYSISSWNTQAYLYFDLTVLPGETITLDLPAQRFTSNFRGDVRSALLPESTEHRFQLLPGTNHLFALAEQGTITMSWATRYWSFDT